MAYINVIFETQTGRMVSGVLPANFELPDMLKLIRDKLDDENAHEAMRFLCKNKQLMLNDATGFAAQKKLITNNVTIRVAKRMIGGFEMVNIHPSYATGPVKSLPNRRCCPKCFQVGAYGNKCQMHTCLNCNTIFCFICLREPAVCTSDIQHCMPVRIQDYSIFPKSTDSC
ncbi:unnamed protein product [Adineta steineri]|uniref:RBR-type E3 ubiquitin transferase n=1 Tax=Adineta steineri TaxID=433720 RepID=A0A814UZ96_9BILA|nr:unnamed protein product [Adineta steineri]CAF1179849.1 unnamed protein product [Adineta steineri]CAF1234840.1 unnamed protein product [Adineta steineri]